MPIELNRYRQRRTRKQRGQKLLFGVRMTTIIPAILLVGAGLAGVSWFTSPNQQSAEIVRFTSSPSCHPSYSGRCLPIGPDLDCVDIGGTVRVVGPDVYRLDADNDGEGCEPIGS